MSETEKPKVDSKYVLSPAAMNGAEFARNVWVVTLEQSVNEEDMERPEFWAHVSPKLRPYDRIEVRASDGTWWAEYLVTDCSRTWARVRRLMYVPLTTSDEAQTVAALRDAMAKGLQEYELRHRGSKGWSAVRKTDGSVLFENVGTKDLAQLQLAQHMRVSEPTT